MTKKTKKKHKGVKALYKAWKKKGYKWAVKTKFKTLGDKKAKARYKLIKTKSDLKFWQYVARGLKSETIKL